MKSRDRVLKIIAQAIKGEDGDGFVSTEPAVFERLAEVVLQALEDKKFLVAKKPLKVYVAFGGQGGPMDTPEIFFEEKDAIAAYNEHAEELDIHEDDEESDGWESSEYTYSWDEVEVK